MNAGIWSLHLFFFVFFLSLQNLKIVFSSDILLFVEGYYEMNIKKCVHYDGNIFVNCHF